MLVLFLTFPNHFTARPSRPPPLPYYLIRKCLTVFNGSHFLKLNISLESQRNIVFNWGAKQQLIKTCYLVDKFKVGCSVAGFKICFTEIIVLSGWNKNMVHSVWIQIQENINDNNSPIYHIYFLEYEPLVLTLGQKVRGCNL